VADGLLPARNVGIVYNNSAVEDRITWAAGIFNNWFDAGKSFSNTPTVITARITGLPFLSEDESNLLHLGVAGRYSNAAGGIRYKAKTEIFSGPVSVDTDLLDDANSTLHLGLEFVWRKGPFILLSEYMQSSVNSSSDNNPVFNGYYVVASYIFTGEMRRYNKRSGIFFNKINIANEVTSGGWGLWEAYCRWSSIDLSDGAIDGGEMTTFSLGLNWWPVTSIQVNVNYRYSELDRNGQTGSNHGLVTRIAFVLE
jgi:phosphate-selective porin OprO/OprP